MTIGYIDAKERGLTGGLMRLKTATPGADMAMAPSGEAPKMFKIAEPAD